MQSSSSGSSTSASGEKAGAKASGTLTVGFHYENDSGGDCNLSTTETVQDSDLPYNESFDPANFSGSLSSGCGSPADFDGVQVEFAPGSGFPTSGLVLSLLDENGTEITSDDNLSDGLGVSGTVSDDVDLPDDIGGGDDEGGDDGGSDDSGDDDGGGDGGGDDGDTAAPNAPANLSGNAGDGSVTLNWDAVSASDLDGYNVYRSTSSISDVSGKSPLNGSLRSGTSYTDDGASNGTTYYYVVTAVDGSGNESTVSSEVTVTPSGGTDTNALVPVKDGNEWKTDFVDPNEDTDLGNFTLEATSDNQFDVYDDGEKIGTTTISQGSNGLVIESVNFEGEETETDVMRFKYPAEAGDSYQHTDGDGYTRTITVSRTTVTVQAGTFENCLQYSVDGYETVTFKPGVGPVRWNSEDGYNRELTSTNVTQ